ncbi:MAG TPA: acyl-CoA dehydrogenase [Pseudonocardiaceae bacterium]|nr:acyl-CoA dehydrogenase [Pseudonocardiaceae bacterium]
MPAPGVLVGASPIDQLLGDPNDDTNPFSYKHIAELDEREEFPDRMAALLDEYGLPAQYVPASHGGGLSQLDTMCDEVRAIARRDLTLAVAHAKTFLGAVSVWVGGRPEQAHEVAAAVAAGTVVSWGLTEPGHGSDLLSGELTATPVEDGFLLEGTKTLINNATRADMVCTLARTDPAGGPRGFSLLMIDKRALGEGSFNILTKIRTHGIRGADISGIAFHGARVPATALVGGVGEGIAIVLKALQLTRTSCIALSLGAADHALSLAHGFAAERVLYGRRLADLPYIRGRLGTAYAMLFLVEAVSSLASRSLHTLTAQASITSSAVKAFVPTTVDDLIGHCGEVLGARAFVTRIYREGMFQKVERDHRIVPIFDGSTHVNQAALMTQFAALGRGYPAIASESTNLDAVAVAADLHRRLPELDLAALRLVSRDGCALVQSLPAAIEEFRARYRDGLIPAPLLADAEALAQVSVDIHEEMARFRPRSHDVPTAAFELARRYDLCFAGAAALRFWLHNHDHVDPGAPLWQGGLWLTAGLRSVLDRLGADLDNSSYALFDRLFEAAAAQRDRTPWPSILSDAAAGADR